LKEKVAIIGGSGFVGSRLAQEFKRVNKEYDIFDINTQIDGDRAIYLDVEDPSLLGQLEGYTVLINLAAVHRDDIRPVTRYDDVNVQGAVNVCNAARQQGINRIIFTSSVAVYGFASPDTLENGEPNFFNDYGRTKYLAENVYKAWHAEDPAARTLVIIRPTVIFGEGNRGNVYNLLYQVASKRFVMVGNGENRKSMAYVGNVAALLNYTLTFNPGFHLFNYIDKPDLDMNTLVAMVRRTLFNKDNVGIRMPKIVGMALGYIADMVALITGKKLPVSSIRVKKFLATTQFASSIKETKFEAPFSLSDGLAKTISYEFMEDNSDKKTYVSE